MPTYVWKCPEGHTEELKISLRDAEKPRYCWECYCDDDEVHRKMKRVIQPAAVHFKGGGWGGSKA